MNSKQTFFGLLGALVLLVVAIGGLVYMGLGVLQKKGDDLKKMKLEQAVLDNRKTALTSAKRDIKTYEPLEKISKSIVPQEKDQARIVDMLYAIADDANLSISSVSFPSSALGEAKKKTKSSKSSSKKSKKPVAMVDPNTTQLTEVPDIKGLYSMEIKMDLDKSQPVPYSRMLYFLSQLEQNRRTAHVTNISISPSEISRDFVTFSLTLNVYVKP